MSEHAGTVVAGTGAAPGERVAAPTEGPTLLLVDDDAPLRRSLQRAMERRGFVVYAAESLQAGLNLAHSVKPEYAVVDLRLEERQRPRPGPAPARAAPEGADRHPHRLRQHRDRRRRREG